MGKPVKARRSAKELPVDKTVDPNSHADFVVDYIRKHRVSPSGQVQYLVRWVGYKKSDDTWEPIESFHSTLVVEEYNRKHGLNLGLLRRTSVEKRQEIAQQNLDMRRQAQRNEIFIDLEDHEEYYETPERVVHMCQSTFNGIPQLVVLMKWKNNLQGEFVPNNWVIQNYPALLIEYYESHLFWRKGDMLKKIDMKKNHDSIN